jgi:hypothetical protein
MRPLPGINKTLAIVSLLIASINLAFAQTTSLASLKGTAVDFKPASVSGTISDDEATMVLNGFLAAEAKVREALNQHAFKRNVVLQTIGTNGEVTGEYIRNSQFVFDDRGRRIERVFFHPKSTIREMRITKEDIQDLSEGQLLGIDIAELTKYRLTYVGIETVGSLQLYAVDIAPRVQPDPNHVKDRFFTGRVWLDPKTFQIAKIKGIVEPQGKQRFPVFETWREPIKSALAFPARTEADDILHFKNADVHYRIKVLYYDYKLFGSNVSITEVEEPASEAKTALPRTEVNPLNPSKAQPERANTTNLTAPIPTNIKQPTVKVVAPPNNMAPCATNRTAPPVGPYHWPHDTEVRVYFLRDMFTSEQRAALVEAMATWTETDRENGSGVKFVDAGETERRMGCRGCLTVGRRDVYKQDKHHYAFFHPMEQEQGRLLVSAWIDLDFGITKPKALKGFMVHELAHGLGLWDCTSCKKKQTIMNGFPGINKDNGLVAPSVCDVATVQDVYHEERQLASSSPQAQLLPGISTAPLTLLALLDLQHSNFPVLDRDHRLVNKAEATQFLIDSRAVLKATGQPPINVQKTSSSQIDLPRFFDERPTLRSSGAIRWQAPPANVVFRLVPLGLDKPGFSPVRMQNAPDYRSWLRPTVSK